MTLLIHDLQRKAVKRMADGFRQFSRNGRWGTCADCPCDSHNHAYPEFCVNTDRYDHQLTANSLANQFENDLKRFEKRETQCLDEARYYE